MAAPTGPQQINNRGHVADGTTGSGAAAIAAGGSRRAGGGSARGSNAGGSKARSSIAGSSNVGGSRAGGSRAGSGEEGQSGASSSRAEEPQLSCPLLLTADCMDAILQMHLLPLLSAAEQADLRLTCKSTSQLPMSACTCLHLHLYQHQHQDRWMSPVQPDVYPNATRIHVQDHGRAPGSDDHDGNFLIHHQLVNVLPSWLADRVTEASIHATCLTSFEMTQLLRVLARQLPAVAGIQVLSLEHDSQHMTPQAAVVRTASGAPSHLDCTLQSCTVAAAGRESAIHEAVRVVATVKLSASALRDARGQNGWGHPSYQDAHMYPIVSKHSYGTGWELRLAPVPGGRTVRAVMMHTVPWQGRHHRYATIDLPCGDPDADTWYTLEGCYEDGLLSIKGQVEGDAASARQACAKLPTYYACKGARLVNAVGVGFTFGRNGYWRERRAACCIRGVRVEVPLR